MRSCKCTLDKPQVHWSQWPWISAYEAWKTSTTKRKGAGRPSLYPKCKEHGNAIYKFTDKSCTLPEERKPVYNCQNRQVKKESGSLEPVLPKPQSAKRRAEPEGSELGTAKKSKLECTKGPREIASKSVRFKPPQTHEFSQWAGKLAADIYNIRVPDARYAHHMMSEVIITQRLNGEPQYTGWEKDFVECKRNSRNFMNKQIFKAAIMWMGDRQQHEVREGS